jgi:mannose-6-phosphate isomerase-like protein (cupin superfamily)
VIEKGQTLTNRVTGERIIFLETAAETGGNRVVTELHVDPGGSGAAAHAHPSQWETLEVIAGRLGAKVARRRVEIGAGQMLGVAPGVPHAWWNAGDDELVVRCVTSPAPESESPIEAMFSPVGERTSRKRTWRLRALTREGAVLECAVLRPREDYETFNTNLWPLLVELAQAGELTIDRVVPDMIGHKRKEPSSLVVWHR